MLGLHAILSHLLYHEQNDYQDAGHENISWDTMITSNTK